ncbi:MAG: DUF3667 domain-containing protein [Alloprevotella sp.]|nr:DUF3667 domain-containing protein [Alloprevotella sp.]
MFEKLKEVLRRIVAWQKRPIQVAENVTEEAVCKNCDETYHANYCPRCGQSRNTPRLGSKSALRIFLDTWGLGTHGLLRTIWHLFARPGYMIGDYIDGRRQLYFPPFKTLFVVGTAYALVFALGGGFSEEAKEARRQVVVDVRAGVTKAMHEGSTASEKNLSKTDAEQRRMEEQLTNDLTAINTYWGQYVEWQQRNRVTDQLLMHILFALIAWRIFRRAPRRPGMNLAENIVAQVYICAQMGVLAIATMLIQMLFAPYPTGTMPAGTSFLLFVYDFKQLYGYSLVRTVWKVLLMHMLFMALTVIFFIFVVLAIGVHVGYATSGM